MEVRVANFKSFRLCIPQLKTRIIRRAFLIVVEGMAAPCPYDEVVIVKQPTHHKRGRCRWDG